MAIKITVQLCNGKDESRTVLSEWLNQSFELWNSSLSKQEMTAIWNGLPNDANRNQMINALGMPTSGIRQPWANPGGFMNGNIRDLNNADIYVQFNNYELLNSPIANPPHISYIVYMVNEMNYFSFPQTGAAGWRLVHNGTAYPTFYAGCPGLRAAYRDSQLTDGCQFLVYGRTTDNQVFAFGPGGNKLNSMFQFLSETSSEHFIEVYTYAPPALDPFSPGGTTQPGGAEGSWTIVNDPVDFPTTPTISVAHAGFVSIWTPTLQQLQTLAKFMWTADPTKIQMWKNLIANPMEMILGLHLLPFQVEHYTLPDRVTMGIIDTGIDMYYTDVQFQEVDCGEINLTEYWGAFLDYAPYTTLDIFLPFIGVRTLNVNDCMPKTIALKYKIDIATGTCVAIIKCDDSVLYHFNGSCAAQVPVTAGQMQEIVRSAISLVTSTVAGAATGGVAGGAMAAVSGAASAIANTGQHASRSGAIGGTSGFMSCLTPYLIVTRPRQALPDEQSVYTGYPSFMRSVLATLEGYTEIEEIHLENVPATDGELSEIENLLKSGVIL